MSNWLLCGAWVIAVLGLLIGIVAGEEGRQKAWIQIAMIAGACTALIAILGTVGRLML
jgi:hypothetical protein